MCQYCNGLHSLYAAHHATHFLFGAHVVIAAYTSVAAFKAKRQILGLIIFAFLKTYRFEILEIVHSCNAASWIKSPISESELCGDWSWNFSPLSIRTAGSVLEAFLAARCKPFTWRRMETDLQLGGMPL